MYEVSVITPFHNVNWDMFKAAAESMMNQTLGFEKIQWIIVVHNSEGHYLSDIRELLGKYENVVIKQLDNELRTPSSPRNYAMEFIDAPYVGFLDGDDSYLEDCLKVALEAIKKSEASVCTFRRKYTLESSEEMPLADFEFWDQTKDMIVVEREDRDLFKMYSGMFGFITSKLFKTSFIREISLDFDESMRIGEDYIFTLKAYSAADRICVLPRLIGYNYYLNSGSLVQSMEKTEEVLLDYATSISSMLDVMYESHVFEDEMSITMLYLISMYIVSSDISKEVRVKLKDILERHVLRTVRQEPSKIYPWDLTWLRYSYPRMVIMDTDSDLGSIKDEIDKIEIFGADVKNKDEVLKAIIRDNGETDLGRAYDFENIYTLEDFEEKVPVSEYEDYHHYILMQQMIGDKWLLVHDEIIYYLCKDDGANLRKPECALGKCSGISTQIPVTKKMLERMLKEISYVLDGKISLLLADTATYDVMYGDFATEASLWGMLKKEYIREREKRFFSSKGRLYALDECDPQTVEQIVIADSNDLLNLSEKTAGYPDLQRIVVMDRGTNGIERPTDINGIPVSYPLLLCEEGVLGIGLEKAGHYELTDEYAYFEFRDEKNLIKRRSEVENGEKYEIVLTNDCGFYRYRTGIDIVIEEISKKNGKVIFSVT